MLSNLESPSSERRSSTTGSGRTGMMFCSLIFFVLIVTRQPYASIWFRDSHQGASLIRVASAQNARQQELVNLGANYRGESWRVAVGLLLHGRRVLFEDDPKGVNGDVSQVGAVL